MANLIMGDKGRDCRKLRMFLNSSLFPSPHLSEDDDYFDFNTKCAVVQFQRYNGLEPDGIVGHNTWKALGNVILPGEAYRLPMPTGPFWMQIVKAELGVHEDPSKGQHNKRILEYNRMTSYRARQDEVHWCSSFVNWVMIKAGYKGTYDAAARSWLKWGIKLNSPREGAITVIKEKRGTKVKESESLKTEKDIAIANKEKQSTDTHRGGYHVSFFIKLLPGHICLLGGNQSDKVMEKIYSLSKYEIISYRWPS